MASGCSKAKGIGPSILESLLQIAGPALSVGGVMLVPLAGTLAAGAGAVTLQALVVCGAVLQVGTQRAERVFFTTSFCTVECASALGLHVGRPACVCVCVCAPAECSARV